MRERFAERWSQARDGFVISCKIARRRKLRNYFVPIANVEEAERTLADGIPPMRWVAHDLQRLSDSDM